MKGARGYIEAVQTGKDPTFFVVLFEDSAAMLGPKSWRPSTRRAPWATPSMPCERAETSERERSKRFHNC